jgi:protein-L-isoaspartate(D-aspartate) O-methyltransferase
MPDYATQRANMVASQLRTTDVADPRIQAAMAAVPREEYVPQARRSAAYSDLPVEVAHGRFLLDPRSFAKMLMLAEIRPTDSVLDVGCATGYSAVVLSKLARTVVALEQDAGLVQLASDLVPAAAAANTVVVQGSLADGFKSRAPYDVIVIEGGIERQPESLCSQLSEGGRLVAVIQNGNSGHAHLFVREKGHVGSRIGFDAVVPVLAGFHKTVGFVF